MLSRLLQPKTDSDRRTSLMAGLGVAALAAAAGYYVYSSRATRFAYPAARRCDHTDSYHGVDVADPYRWLEEVDSAETQAWIGAENALTSSVLEECPGREPFRAKLEQLYAYDKMGCPYRRGNLFFQSRKTGLQNQFVLYKMTSLAADAPAEVLVDPNTLKADGTAALKLASVCEDGSTLAYGVSFSGSDWMTIKVRDVATGADAEEETIEWVKYSGLTWLGNRGFFYARYPAPEGVVAGGDSAADGERHAGTETDAARDQMLYYHHIGTPASEDVLVWADAENPKWMWGTDVSDDERTLFISASDSCDPVNRLYYCRIPEGRLGEGGLGPVVKLVDNFDAGYDFVASDGLTAYFRTNLGAPKKRIVRATLPEADAAAAAAPPAVTWEEVVPEQAAVLEAVVAAGEDKLLLVYVRDCKEEVDVVALRTGQRLGAVALADPGMVAGLRTRREHQDAYMLTSGFLDPGTAYVLSLDGYTGGDLAPQVVRETSIPGFDRSRFATEQRWFASKDGTRVPMFVLRGAAAAPQAKPLPTILYGYGGFSISLTPSFSLARLLWVQNFGGVYAVANLRGGGEYGDEWHKAGCGASKQNVFDDFAAAAEALVADGTTTPAQLGIVGGSNGGLLVAASVTQRPELFGAGVAQVPVTDMLRFHQHGIGYAWTSDYGCADESREAFDALFAYSPVHNVRADAGRYPALMVTTADHDDRVAPLHSYKFVAAVQHALRRDAKQTQPQIIRVETDAGHGAGKPTSKIIDEAADTYGFLAHYLGGTWSG